MQWLLQEFDDTRRLAEVLDSLAISYSWHSVVPFIGDLIPEPSVPNPEAVILFGSYTLWKYAEAHRYWPGVFKLRPFVHETIWHPYLLNGRDARFIELRDIPVQLIDDGKTWFVRCVEDSKEEPGNVKSSGDIIRMAEQVLTLEPDEIPDGSLCHSTVLMLTEPVHILKEWRLWIVGGQVITYSLYKDGANVIHRHDIDEDVLEFAQRLVNLNPHYAEAYVMDICRTDAGLKLLETNCINAAGFYAADLSKLVIALEDLGQRR